MSGLGIMQREILRRARGPFSVREIALKLYPAIDDTKLGAIGRAVRSLQASGYLVHEPLPTPAQRKRGEPIGLYRRTSKQATKRREWRNDVSQVKPAAPMRAISFQRERRDAESRLEPRARDTKLDYVIGPIDADEAAEFIRRYEYLGTVNTNPLARYCARNAAGEVVAVAMFGRPHVQSAAICREIKNVSRQTPEDKAYLKTVVCLERGACASWAHEHTGSWFVTRALERAHKDHGWKIFYAYSDETAGELGVIYQACGWMYLGQGTGRNRTAGAARPRQSFRHRDWPEDKWVTDRAFYRRRLMIEEHVGRWDGEDVAGGLSDQRPWEVKETIAKHKYVQFVCGKNYAERRALMKALRYPILTYPKRLRNDQ